VTFADYEAHGWKLCAIDGGSKGPRYDGWNVAAMPAETIEVLGQGAGLLHSLSGTCAIDIDDLTAARAWWAEHGVDIDALCDAPDSVHICSGRAGRDKLLYRLSKPLRTFRPKGSGTELRCATAGGESVQDVLPPSIHPITKKSYFWYYRDELVGDWRNLPNIPANIFRVWRDLIASEPAREVVNEKPQTVDAGRLREAVAAFIATRKLDIDSYDDWIALGMRIHKQTDGSMRTGLALWDEFSKTSPKYAGIDDLRTHWVSFDAGGKIGLDAAIRDLPAEADDFETITEAAPDEETTALVELKAKGDKIKAAQEFLRSRLIYIKTLEKYFDREDHHLFLTNQGIEHTLADKVPRKISVLKLLRDMGSNKPIVSGLAFHPGEGTVFTEFGDTYANVYRPRLPEPLEPTTAELEKIEWLFARVHDVPYREWLRQFFGHVVQHPGVKIKSAPLIWSKIQGNGKTTLIAKLPALLVGTQYSVEISASELGGSFNDQLRRAWHVNLPEFRVGSRSERDLIAKKVEGWIADDMVSLHQKGMPAATMPNHFFLTASSNAEDAAMITNDDRKWAIHRMLAPKMTEQETVWINEEFFKTPRGPGVLRHYFLNVDITSFNPNARAPETEAKAEMARANLPRDVELLTVWFEERSGPLSKDIVRVVEVVDELYRAARCQVSPHRIGGLLSESPFNGARRRIRNEASGQVGVTIIRNHEKWLHAPEKDVLAYLNSDEISVEDDLLS
jgi:hypothetical protein